MGIIETIIPYGVTLSHEDHDWVITDTGVQPLIDFIRWVYTGSPELNFRRISIQGLHDTTPDIHEAIRESLGLRNNIRLKIHGNLLYMDFRSSKPYSFVYRIHGNMILSVFPPPPSPFTNLPVDYWVSFVSDLPVSTPNLQEISLILREGPFILR